MPCSYQTIHVIFSLPFYIITIEQIYIAFTELSPKKKREKFRIKCQKEMFLLILLLLMRPFTACGLFTFMICAYYARNKANPIPRVAGLVGIAELYTCKRILQINAKKAIRRDNNREDTPSKIRMNMQCLTFYTHFHSRSLRQIQL